MRFSAIFVLSSLLLASSYTITVTKEVNVTKCLRENGKTSNFWINDKGKGCSCSITGSLLCL
ncbi:hypothetical protein BB561_001967 [Smittium simulii]|uniref:Uncharacterized protein n=1 Tax=Smittium simulii TaxID=133385 RepID=A0A2T9YS58_9FUNG|nr:hypothetical protein BB561_001967 [Smittium simulii]